MSRIHTNPDCYDECDVCGREGGLYFVKEYDCYNAREEALCTRCLADYVSEASRLWREGTAVDSPLF